MATRRIVLAGGGYTDETTNERGDVVGTITYTKDEVVTEHTEIYPDSQQTKKTSYKYGKPITVEETYSISGDVKTIELKNGKPSVSKTIDRDGKTIETERYNENGQVYE